MANRKFSSHTFSMTPTSNIDLFNRSELPNYEIKVTILLTSLATVFNDLSKRLRDDNMDTSPHTKNRNAIVVKGIPSSPNYDRQNILNVVREFDQGARIIA